MKPNQQPEDERSYKEVGTKVSPQTFLLVSKLCVSRGLRIYNLMQMAFECFEKMMSDKHNLTPEMQRLMTVFEGLNGWRNAFSLAEPDVPKLIGEAIYFLYDATGQRHGTRAVHVKRPQQGEWTDRMPGMPGWEEDTNMQHILERLLCLMCPDRYRRLRALAAECGCNSQLELLDYVIDYFAKVQDDEEMARIFSDADRAENGRALRYGDRTRKKQRITLDMFEQRRNEE